MFERFTHKKQAAKPAQEIFYVPKPDPFKNPLVETNPYNLGLSNLIAIYAMVVLGLNLFIASYRFHKPVTMLYASTIPFMFILLAAVLVITYWPDLTMYLVNNKSG